MNKTYYVLTEEDRRELYSNVFSFSLPLRSYIYSHMDRWFDNTSIPSPKEEILKHVISEIDDDRIRKYLLSLLSLQAETLEDIRNLLRSASLRWEHMQIKLYDNNSYLSHVKKALEVLLFDILCTKFDAYELAEKIKIPDNGTFFACGTLRDLMKNIKENCLKNKNGYGRCLNNAILMNIVFKMFQLDPLLYGAPFLSYFECIDPKDKLDVRRHLERITGMGEYYDVFKDIEKVENFPISDIKRQKPVENCDKKRMIKIGRGKMILLGDDIFGNITNPRDFLQQYSHLDEELISEYHKGVSPDQISFSLSENDLGFLEYEYHYKKCVVKVIGGMKYFISVTIGNTPKIFLLYKIESEPDKIFAISAYTVRNYKNREILTFQEPKDCKYEIQSEGVGINR